MHSHEHASFNMFLFNDRLEHVCLEELCLITCLLESFNDTCIALDEIWCDMYARWMLGDAMLDEC